MSNDFAVTVSNLSVCFDNFYAVKNISFSVKRGEVFGFLGANGAGKTTTIRVLCGLLYPTAGHVQVAGIGLEAGEIAIKSKVGYMSQKFTLYNDLTVEENLSFTASLRKLDLKTYLQRRAYLLEFISFKKPLNSFVKNLSAGIKQQVSLAASILHDPEVIFLDEPTAGVSPAMRVRFWNLINDLAKNGKTVFVTTHYMDEAEQCNRIALMRTGEIIALDTPSNLKKKFFSGKVYELSPREEVSYSKVTSLHIHPEFEFFEPYGLRFHAEFKKSSEAEKFKETLNQDFEVKEITPTLEDVFIKATEGDNA